jgi:hypothetical protein
MTLKTKKIIAREFLYLLLAAVLTLLLSSIIVLRNNYYQGIVNSQTAELVKIEKHLGINKEAIRDAYDLAVKDGYTHTIDDFKSLIYSNPEALSDAYNLVVKDGYTHNIDDFKTLMGAGLVADQENKNRIAINASIFKTESKINSYMTNNGLSVIIICSIALTALGFYLNYDNKTKVAISPNENMQNIDEAEPDLSLKTNNKLDQMNKVNFEIAFKIIVVVLLISILLINIKSLDSTTDIGRYKEIRIPSEDGYIKILDTTTGESKRVR